MNLRTTMLGLVALLASACASPPPRVIEAGEPVTAFTGVTVITEYGGDRLENHTVAVRGDRIVAIGRDGSIVLPEGSTVVRSPGQVLAPGLADMHVHWFNHGYGPLLLANSITTVRNPSGGEGIPQLIAAVASGRQPGPTMYSSGQLIDGPTSFWGPQVTTTTPEQVRERVRADAAAGYMAIKLYAMLSPEQFAAGVEEARAHNLQIYAHVPRAMTLEQVLAHRIDSIEHLDGFDRSLGGEGEDPARRWTGVRADRFAPVAQEVAQSGVWNAPTLIVLLAPSRAFADMDAAGAAPEMRYADAGLLAFWRGIYDRLPSGSDRTARYRMIQEGHRQRIAMLRALHEAGAPLLIGTDTPNPYVVPGFSIHEEIGFFRDAGFTPTQILRIATLDAARFLNKEGEFGRVAEGARADLLLLSADPEQDLSVLRAPAGVMAAGRWYDRAALDEMLRAAAEAAAQPATPPQQ